MRNVVWSSGCGTATRARSHICADHEPGVLSMKYGLGPGHASKLARGVPTRMQKLRCEGVIQGRYAYHGTWRMAIRAGQPCSCIW